MPSVCWDWKKPPTTVFEQIYKATHAKKGEVLVNEDSRKRVPAGAKLQI